MKIKSMLLKGALIFGIVGFALFLVLIVFGMVMSALGFTCDCYKIFAWSLIGVASISGGVFWFGCCCNRSGNENCQGLFGFKDETGS